MYFVLGLNIIEETTFLIKGYQEMHFNWEEFGFQLSVPDLYLISSPERSQKEVTIEIKHCVHIGDLPHNKKLQFISSVLDTSDKCHFMFNRRGEISYKKGNMGHQ